MRNAALMFPALVAETPMRTHAILTKYTALRSYHAHFGGLKMPAFEMAGVYSTILQEAYLDFKTVAKNLQVLAYDVSAGQTRLIAASDARKKLEQASNPAASAGGGEGAGGAREGDAANTPSTSEGGSTGSPDADGAVMEATPSAGRKTNNGGGGGERGGKNQQLLQERPYNWSPIVITEDYPPTLQGLEDARAMVRTILVRIVQEINILSKFPEAATDEQRVQPHISPFLFKERLPVSVAMLFLL